MLHQISQRANSIITNEHDLQKILAWFIIDYFTHNIDLISQSRKNFRLQNSTDDTVIAEQSIYIFLSNPEKYDPS